MRGIAERQYVTKQIQPPPKQQANQDERYTASEKNGRKERRTYGCHAAGKTCIPLSFQPRELSYLTSSPALLFHGNSSMANLPLTSKIWAKEMNLLSLGFQWIVIHEAEIRERLVRRGGFKFEYP
jgi:hypothetical protein